LKTQNRINQRQKKTCQPFSTGQPTAVEIFQGIPEKTINEAGLMKNEITITRRGMVISKHPSGVICGYDSRHRILKVRLQGGVIAELVQERTGSDTISGEYRNQLLTVNNGSEASIIEF
jgi:hypothetical protein